MLRLDASPLPWEGGRRGQWLSGQVQLRARSPCELQGHTRLALALCFLCCGPTVISWAPCLGFLCFENGAPVRWATHTSWAQSEGISFMLGYARGAGHCQRELPPLGFPDEDRELGTSDPLGFEAALTRQETC